MLEEATRDWLQARDLAEHGEFAQALDAVEKIRRRLLDPPAALAKFAGDLERQRKQFPGLLVRLHEAADVGRWREVVELACNGHPESYITLLPVDKGQQGSYMNCLRAAGVGLKCVLSPIDATSGWQ